MSTIQLRSACLALALAYTGVIPARAQNAARSLWQMDGITLRLEARGDERTWVYERIPPDIAAREGIGPGATFWQGRRVGAALVGQLFLYGAGCQPFAYAVSRSARLDAAGEVVLTGANAERAGSDCSVGRRQSAAPIATRLKLLGKPEHF